MGYAEAKKRSDEIQSFQSAKQSNDRFGFKGEAWIAYIGLRVCQYTYMAEVVYLRRRVYIHDAGYVGTDVT